ncbi:c-type cytochrome biogenesis protein CcmI [uncultured Abyssibacter sp.]|uniref:c-type cytochrome biogenesis protein CcmI n=1 Tax=uncultured Abyssibacter sp. TaxID=2320202 RepID=UPI0032B12D23
MKTLLIALFAGLALAAMIFPAWALRHLRGGRRSRQADNIAAFRSRKAELEADLAAGRINQEAFEQLENDAAAELLMDAQSEEGTLQPGGRWMSVAAIIVVPIVGVGLYLASGGLPPMSHAEQMAGLVQQLESRVSTRPDDLDARRMLGRVYMGTERYQQAAQMYRQINEHTGNSDADALIAEGEALGMSRNQDWLGRPAALFDAALDIEPNHTRGLWYGSLAAAQDGKHDIALLRLQRLDRQPLEDPLASAVRNAVIALGGVPADVSAPAETEAPEAARPDAPEAGTRIDLNIELSPALHGDVPGRFTLFVFAKHVSGPPMPLAAKRLESPAFPLSITLTSEDAMMPGMSLDNADQWAISARISRAGDARASSGDLQGGLVLSRDALDGRHTVIIDEQVP